MIKGAETGNLFFISPLLVCNALIFLQVVSDKHGYRWQLLKHCCASALLVQVYPACSRLMQWARIDDPVDAVAVHAGHQPWIFEYWDDPLGFAGCGPPPMYHENIMLG